MVGALDFGSSGPGLGAGWGHCVVFFTLTVPLSTQEYKWVSMTKCWAVTCDGLVFHPGGVAILLVGFILRNLRYAPRVWPEYGFTLAYEHMVTKEIETDVHVT